GCWCPDRRSPSVLENGRRNGLVRGDDRGLPAARWLAAAPARAPFDDELVEPIEVRWSLDRTDRGDRSAPFRDGQSPPRSHLLQVPTEIRLELANADGFHATTSQVTTIVA